MSSHTQVAEPAIAPDFPRGVKLLHDPARNKGTAFTEEHVPTTWLTLADPAEWLWGGNPDRSTRYFDGMMDEIRVSDVVRSQEWLQTSFENQDDPGMFLAVGAEEQRDLVDVFENLAADIIASGDIDEVTVGRAIHTSNPNP